MMILEVQTTRGKAKFHLRDDGKKLVIWFYGRDGIWTGGMDFSVLQPDAIYNDGAWNLSLIQFIITNYEP